MNKLELTKDNHTVYINGVKVEDIDSMNIEIKRCMVTISFPAEIGVRNDSSDYSAHIRHR